MRILVLTFYYPPDLSAGSFRTNAFVTALRSITSAQDEIDVVTTLPNRYHSFALDAPAEETQGNVRIRRVRLPGHKSGMIDQARAFGSFALGAFRCTADDSYDLVYATSSRLFTAFLGALFARRKGAVLYLDIRDIFVDTIADVLKGPGSRIAMPFLKSLEAFTFRSADRINLVSEGFRDYFHGRYPGKSYSYYTNGIDDDFLSFGFRATAPYRSKNVVLYAGNIGEGQGLHNIVPGMARRLAESWEFWVVGGGGRSQALLESIEQQGLDNVKVMPPVRRPDLIELYRKSDVLFLHLNDYDAFRKVLPSKIFEYAATGKPVLAGVAGHAAQFLERNVDNAAVFAPCDVDAGVKALAGLELRSRDRQAFVARFRRTAIMKELAVDVLSLVRANPSHREVQTA